MKHKPTIVSKENHHHSEVAIDKSNFKNSDIRNRMMNDECKNSHEENYKRVECAINRGGNKIIRKMARTKNK